MTLSDIREMTDAWDALAPRWASMTPDERKATKARYRATITNPESDRVSVLKARFILGAIELSEESESAHGA